MDRINGKTKTGIAHLEQSIRDIIATPIGSRVMRREYGSRLLSLVDAPVNQGTLIEIYAATADALKRWEPRFRLLEVKADIPSPGNIILELEGEYLPENKMISVQNILVLRQ